MAGATGGPAADVWSTAVVEPARAFEYWRDLICDTFVQLAATPTTDGAFAGQIHHAAAGGLEISTVRAGGQRVRRTPALIARAGEEFLLASIQTGGRGRVEQDGRVAVLEPGAMALYDSTRPYTLHFDAAFEQVVVQVPLAGILAETGLRDAAAVTAVPLPADGPAGAVAQFFRGLSLAYATDPVGTAAVATHGRGLLVSALAISHGRLPSEGAARSLAVQRVRTFVADRHTDPALTADDIARAALVSRRTLYRLFEGVPGGVLALVRRARVRHAQALLRAQPSRPLESVALAVGFAGERQFYRAFQHEAGCTPGEYRAGAPGQ